MPVVSARFHRSSIGFETLEGTVDIQILHAYAKFESCALSWRLLTMVAKPLSYEDYPKLETILAMIRKRNMQIGYFRYGFYFGPLRNVYLEGSVLHCEHGIVSKLFAFLTNNPRAHWADHIYVRDSCVSYSRLRDHIW
jgi:hypothetical protein